MATATSPVMQQYARAKAGHPDALVLFRMGDFYELFGDDALLASTVLGITLTRRRTAQAGDEGVPMCGVPYHAAEGYIGKLLEQGHKVALVEQTETPEQAKKARGSGALVQREVVRLLTPGTLTEEAYLPSAGARYLVALAAEDKGKNWVLAWLDLSTGEVGWRWVGETFLAGALAALPVGELLLAQAEPPLLALLASVVPRQLVSVQPQLFVLPSAQGAVQRAYGQVPRQVLGLTDDLPTVAVGALLGYAELTQVGKLPPLHTPRQVQASTRLRMDAQTRRSLDLLESTSGKRADTLLGLLDATKTQAGSRLLARWIAEPLTELAPLLARQASVQALLEQSAWREELRGHLRLTGDVARCVSRLLLGRGSPRDLGVLRQTGQQLPALAAALATCEVPLLLRLREGLLGLESLTDLLSRALAEEPLPALVRDGGFVRDGFDAALDTQRGLQRDGDQHLQQLETREAAASGLPVKLKYNQVWGYFLELTQAQLAGKTVPTHWVHRQTTTTTQRFVTPELMTLERDLASAGAVAQQREEAVLTELVAAVQAQAGALVALSESLATLDVLAALATTAATHGWVRPTLCDGGVFDVRAGRHPMVSARLSTFVPNDCTLTDGQLWLLTGPNMAGKSTFLKQQALLVILAQLGSWVPADTMQLGLVDAIYSRIGAADDLATGQSTFMVEMTETAGILHGATARSLLILDELGRGTATYDGLAIAWAVVEDVVQRLGCRTLLATHYHELTALAQSLPRVSCWQAKVAIWQDEVVFLHKIEPGAAAGSLGVQVAKLAGLPNHVVTRAQALLNGFMKSAQSRGVLRVDELSLFAAPVAAPAPARNVLAERLQQLQPDELSPRAAWEILAELKATVTTL